MSAQELRDILDAELAELSDCDVSDETDDLDQSYITEKFRYYENVGDICTDEDETSCLDNVEEWQELMSSAAQVEERIQGMMISLSDNFETLIYSGIDDVGHELQTHDAHFNLPDIVCSSAVESCCYSVVKNASDHPLRTTQSYHDSNILSTSYCEHEEFGAQDTDVITLEELKVLMNFVIEAVERSAPINIIQLPKIAHRAIDFSSLPQEIKDDNDDHIQFVGQDGDNLDVSENFLPDSCDYEIQTQQSIINERALNATADVLRYEAVVASERILARKEVHRERKKIMEQELLAHRVDVSVVRSKGEKKIFPDCQYLVSHTLNVTI